MKKVLFFFASIVWLAGCQTNKNEVSIQSCQLQNVTTTFNKGESYSIFQYDDEEKLIQQEYELTQTNNHLLRTTQYFYNEQNQISTVHINHSSTFIINGEEFNADNSLFLTFYREGNNVVRIEEAEAETAAYHSYTLLSYNEQNQLTDKEFYSQDDIYRGKFTFAYDEQGNVSNTYEYNENNQLISSTSYIYDEQPNYQLAYAAFPGNPLNPNNIIKQSRWIDSNDNGQEEESEILTTEYTYTYNAQGFPVTQSIPGEDSVSQTTTYVYQHCE